MSRLRERLQRMRPQEVAETVEEAELQTAVTEESLQTTTSEVHTQEPLRDWANMQAYEQQTDAGAFILRKRIFSGSTQHGRYAFNELQAWFPALAMMQQTKEVSAWRLEQMLFVDTETTGLGLGAGNFPFMIAYGYIDQTSGDLVVEQCLIRNPGEEPAMLAYLSERWSRFTCAVSFNGRTFDWPLIKNRFIMNRLPLELADAMLQLDLLYPSRSLWRRTLPSCRLGQIEEDRLAIIREDDMPGAQAPVQYFRFLSEGDPMLLQGVFEHNEQDIMSLVVLSAHYARLLSGQLSEEECRMMSHEELMRHARWFEKVGQADEAAKLYARLGERTDLDAAVYWLESAAWYKRQGNWERAVQLWEQVASAQLSGEERLTPLLELAMYCEHRSREWERAVAITEQAIAWLDKWSSVFGTSLSRLQQRQQEWTHRLARLQRKRDNAAAKIKRKRTEPAVQQEQELLF